MIWRFCGHWSGRRMGESFDSNELSVYFLWKWVWGSHTNSREKGSAEHTRPKQQAPPFEEQQGRAGLDRQLCLPHMETSAHTLEQWAQLLLFSLDLIVTRRFEPSPLTCTAKRQSVINFVLPGQTLQHFPSTFWGYLQGYCSGQWIFLHSCLVMLQVHNTHSTIPKARRLGCQDSPCEYVLPFETQTTKENKRKKKYNWKRYVHRLPLYEYSIHAHFFKAVSLCIIC